MPFARIIIPVALEGTYTYRITDQLIHKVCIGSAVVVNFGKSKLYTGIVDEITDEIPKITEVKDILSCSQSKLVTKEQLDLWKWIAKYYCCTLGEVMKAALPSGLKPDSEAKFFQKNNFYDFHLLCDKQKIIFNSLSRTKPVGVNEIIKTSGIKNPIPDLNRLLQINAVSSDQFLTKVYKPLLKKFVALNFDNDESAINAFYSIKRSEQQTRFLSYLVEKAGSDFSKYETELQNVVNQTNVSSSIISVLVKKSLISVTNKEVSRLNDKEAVKSLKNLDEPQTHCLNQIKDLFCTQNVVLLHGVTSSGKTEIYLRLIDDAIRSGKTALFLLPEIAITTQMVHRVKDVFGEKTGVYHSKYSDAEKVEVWNKLNDGSLKVILGVRSSVFLPFRNLGIIIVDEEQETTYKQNDPAPRYHARDVAIIMAQFHGAKVLLGTATPSIETYFNACEGKYGFTELTTRFGNIAMPQIIITDVLQARKRKVMQFHFHPLLLDEIRTALHKKEQVILFQNRRGYSPYIECTDCGWVPKCEQCNVSLTYHKQKHKMLCHYCGYSLPLLKECPECKSTSLKTMGFGTEMVETEIQHFFPDARIARLDLDAAGTKAKYEKILDDFENQKTDILIGTQMISKGLDFENVSVVGIINADNMLNFPDFRAFERSFQLMMQVSGRAGRKNKQGKVIIQTTMPDHDIIKDVVRNDYKNMAGNELVERRNFKYPPFYKFIKIKLKHKSQSILQKASTLMAQQLTNILPGRIMGPQEPLVNRVQLWYLSNIIIRFEPEVSTSKIKSFVLQQKEIIQNHHDFRGIQISLDVDPL